MPLVTLKSLTHSEALSYQLFPISPVPPNRENERSPVFTQNYFLPAGRHRRERRHRLRGVQHHLGDRGVRVGGGAGALPELVLGGEGLLLLPHLHHRPPLHHRQRIRLLVRFLAEVVFVTSSECVKDGRLL